MNQRSSAIVLPVRSRCKPRPSKLYPILWRFACERQVIYMRRVSGEPSPYRQSTTERKTSNLVSCKLGFLPDYCKNTFDPNVSRQ